MKAINAPVTKPLAFLTFADMYKSDPSPYIIEGLTNLAVKHAEYIPGVSTQLIALTMKEAELKTQILAYYDRKEGKSTSLRMDRDLQVALLDELSITLGSAFEAARSGAKTLQEQEHEDRHVLVESVVNVRIAECIREIWDEIWDDASDDKSWSSLMNRDNGVRPAIRRLIQSETGTGIVVTETQLAFIEDRLEEFVRFKATTLSRLDS